MTAMLQSLLWHLITQTSPTLLLFSSDALLTHYICILCAVLVGYSRDYCPQRILDSGGRSISDPGIILKLVLLLYYIRHSIYWTKVFINTSSNWEIWCCLVSITISFIFNGGSNCYLFVYLLVEINRGTSGVQVILIEKSFDYDEYFDEECKDSVLIIKDIYLLIIFEDQTHHIKSSAALFVLIDMWHGLRNVFDMNCNNKKFLKASK